MMKQLRSRFIAGLAGLLFAGMATAKLFVPDAEPWDMWIIADQTNPASIDHSGWQQVLNLYLVDDAADGINRFDYAGFTIADRVRLDEYISRLAAIDPRDYKRIEQLAYWINLYNAVTVQVVLENYPVQSIRSIQGGLLSPGPWNEPLVTVAGQSLSLNDIEHRILRPIWQDARIHYVVNCASLGCPDLAAQVYTAANAEQMLDAGARAYINHPRGVELVDGKLRLSSIYNWYDVDFGSNQAERIEHLRTFAEPELKNQLNAYKGKINYAYDWQLNDL
jgi:hypothetical protein